MAENHRDHDIIGKRFGRLKVVRFSHTGTSYRRYFLCDCNCGKAHIATRNALLQKDTRSCGCYQKERRDCRKGIPLTHGMSRTRVHNIWKEMHKRCRNDTYKDFHLYGGKGISVCKRWRKFEFFFSDMGAPPTDKHSIDRINSERDYKPSNCRWATSREQANNTTRNRYLLLGSERITVANAARKYGFSATTLYGRIDLGWTDREVVGLDPHKGTRVGPKWK